MFCHIESHNDIDQPTLYYDYFADIFTFDILLHSRALQCDRFRFIFTNIDRVLSIAVDDSTIVGEIKPVADLEQDRCKSFDVAKYAGLDHRIEVVAPLRVPVGVAVPAMIDRKRSIVRRNGRSEVVPDVRLVPESVQQDQRHALLAPLEDVEHQAVSPGHAT